MNTNNKPFARRATLLTLAALLVASLPAFAGRVGGPGRVRDTVLADQVDSYTMRFYGQETARIAAVGDGDIDIFVYDSRGNLVARDNDDDNVPVVSWTPRWTGSFTVRVVNSEGEDVDYVLQTN